MIDFAAARRMMVDGQVRTSDVTDPRLIAAMAELPRERFFPEDRASLAYLDRDVAVAGEGASARRLLKPMVLAKLIHAANVGETDRVLDIGCATGYSTAVLARLSGSVVGLEQDPALARTAAGMLAAVGAANAKVVTGALTRGAPEEGPYDCIVLQGGAEQVPDALFDQLKDGGRLVGVVGTGPATKARVYLRVGADISARGAFDASAPLLPGFARPAEFVF